MWYVYILKCSKDNSLYTGITNNLDKRLEAHNNGKGAKYTRSRRPVRLLKYFEVDNKNSALILEHYLKSLSRAEKLLIIKIKGNKMPLPKKTKKKTTKRGRNAKTGKFVSIEETKKHPETTVVETIKKK